MDKSGKKAVRFSSPFEISGKELQLDSRLKQPEITLQRDASKYPKDKKVPDSWDVFDAKMLTTKDRRGPVFNDVHNQFLELSSTQNKSLNVADEDFSVLSFQDARDLINKDENERLQFLNSNISFSDGIEQMEAPSLLSVTSYFQQGSSFPVPYVGNDSTMMFGESRQVLPAISDGISLSRRSSRSNPHDHVLPLKDIENTSDSRKLDNSSISSDPKKALSKNDSLATFFLGPQSDGLNKMDIMDYVLDYCKRRASLRLSDASDIVTSPSLNNSSKNVSCERHDSGIGAEDRAVNAKKTFMPPLEKERNLAVTNFGSSTDLRISETHANIRTMATVNDKEESVIISDGASLKDKDVLNISEVGSIDGFEKFKKNLNTNTRRKTNDEHRYRGKSKHHEQFETKRLNIDERNSHPKLNDGSRNGQGTTSTATLERSTKISYRSPPEKLVRPKIVTVFDSTTHSTKQIDSTPTNSLLEAQLLSSGGQIHSTPVTVPSESSMANAEKHTLRRKDTKTKSSNLVAEKLNDIVENKFKGKRYVQGANSDLEANNCYLSDVSVQSSKELNSERRSKRRDSSRKKVIDKHIDPIHRDTVDANTYNGQSKLFDPVSQRNTLKPCDPSYKPTQQPTHILGDPSSVVPIIHSAVAQQYQAPGNQPCACSHHYGQKTTAPQGLFPGVGLPIVIHIHLPCTTAASGTVVHPVPTTQI